MQTEPSFLFAPENHVEVFRALETACKNDISPLLEYLEKFIQQLPTLKKDAEIRSAAKICELLTRSYYEEKNPTTRSFLHKNQREKVVEICFDWLLSEQKVAPQAHSMTCLQWLGTEFRWVHPELQTILEQNYSSGSAGYQARARMILKKISR